MENKIAKTEHSIQLLEEHLTNQTCPKSLRYTAKPNITPDETFEKELTDIKLDAEQSLVDALTRFHKRKLEGQKNKLRAFSKPNARKNKCDKATFQRYAIKKTHCKPQQCKLIRFAETDFRFEKHRFFTCTYELCK